MAKGKYTARAANRAAALDNEVICELRSKLEELAAEKRKALGELERLRTTLNSQVMARVEQQTAEQRTQMKAHLAETLAMQREAMSAAADELAHLLALMFGKLHAKYGDIEAFIPIEVTNRITEEGPSLLRVLDLLDGPRAGELMEMIMTPTGTGRNAIDSRSRRRRSARDVDRDLAYFDELHKKSRIAKKFMALGASGNE